MNARHFALLSVLATLGLACTSTASWWTDGLIGNTTPEDPAIACPLAIPADTLADRRAACAFGAGASVHDTLGLAADVPARIPIRHVIVLMKENRSFDHILGRLHDQGQPGVEAIPADFVNRDLNHVAVPPTPATTTCDDQDPEHGWTAMHAMVNNGDMDGFVRSAATSTGTDGHLAMSYHDQGDLPFYTWLARTFAIDDRHFASALTGTYPNRDFLLFGTADGVRDTGTAVPSDSTPSLFGAIEKAGYTWMAYSDGSPLSGALGWGADHAGVGRFGDLLAALDAGTLPNVAFVDGIDDKQDDHPFADLQEGEAWVRQIYDHAVASPQWPRLAIVWTYDECGGFADHVPPPLACVARPIPLDLDFIELGPRVPLVVISPYSRPNFVSHVVEDHTAITRFIEAVFDLPALTARDANSAALLDLLDFGCTPPMLHPPAPPATGTGGCLGG